jgi:hypothetical protein
MPVTLNPFLGGPAPDHARFMGVQLHFKTEKIVHKFFLVTLYHPHLGKDTETIEGFYDSLDSFILQAPKDIQFLWVVMQMP